jgi:hypothetical protein
MGMQHNLIRKIEYLGHMDEDEFLRTYSSNGTAPMETYD